MQIVIHTFARSWLGWTAYIVISLLLLWGIAWLSRSIIPLLKSTFISFGWWKGALRSDACASRVARLSWVSTLVPAILAACGLVALLWTFIGLVILEPISAVTFNETGMVLHYRWPWQDVGITYDDITRTELSDIRANVFGEEVRRSRWRKSITIWTYRNQFVIDPKARGYDDYIERIYQALQHRRKEP